MPNQVPVTPTPPPVPETNVGKIIGSIITLILGAIIIFASFFVSAGDGDPYSTLQNPIQFVLILGIPLVILITGIVLLFIMKRFVFIPPIMAILILIFWPLIFWNFISLTIVTSQKIQSKNSSTQNFTDSILLSEKGNPIGINLSFTFQTDVDKKLGISGYDSNVPFLLEAKALSTNYKDWQGGGLDVYNLANNSRAPREIIFATFSPPLVNNVLKGGQLYSVKAELIPIIFTPGTCAQTNGLSISELVSNEIQSLQKNSINVKYKVNTNLLFDKSEFETKNTYNIQSFLQSVVDEDVQSCDDAYGSDSTY